MFKGGDQGQIPLVGAMCHTAPKQMIYQHLVSGTIEFILLVSKVPEFFVIRYLMNLIGIQRKITPVNLNCMRGFPVQVAPEDKRTKSESGSIEKTVNDDNDDDVTET